MITHTTTVNGYTVSLTYDTIRINGLWLIWDYVNVCYVLDDTLTGPRRFGTRADALAYLEQRYAQKG